MRETFLSLYRQLSRAAIASLWCVFGLFLVTLGCALLGFPRAAESFGQGTLALAYFGAALFALLAIAYLVQAVGKRLAARNA